MRKLILITATLLLVQIGLVVAVNMGNRATTMSAVDTVFLSNDVTDTDDITVTDGEGKVLHMVLQEGKWQLPASQNAQADKVQINDLLGRLAGIKQGFTVATSAEAARRFKVADGDFERRVVLKKGQDTVADFYLGTSPGFRQIHARKEGAQGIVTLALSTFEFDADPQKWLDKSVLQIKDENLANIRLKDISLARKDKEWVLEGHMDGPLDQDEVNDLLGRIENLTVQDVMSADRAKELFVPGSELSMSVGLGDGSVLSYDFVQDDENSYGLRRSDQNVVYKVHKIVVEGLSGFNRERLMKKAEAPGSEENQTNPSERDK